MNRDDVVPEEQLPRYVVWPARPFTPEQVRETFRGVRHFIDFDGTISEANPDKWPPRRARSTLLGKPLEAFLAATPYIVQTRGIGVELFFDEWYPAFPKPLLIIMPPLFMRDTPDRDNFTSCKNLAALGITGVTIIADMDPASIHAPGCIILPP